MSQNTSIGNILKMIISGGLCMMPLALNATPSPRIPDAYIVQVDEAEDHRGVADKAQRKLGGEVKHIYSHALHGFSIRVPNGVRAQQLLTMDHVVSVEPDLEMSIVKSARVLKGKPPGKGGGGDGGDSQQPAQVIPTGISRMNATGILTVDADVAVLDTGVASHPDINLVGGVNFIGRGKSYADKNGHGTHVAGTIGAIDNDIGVVGVAPGVRIYGVKVLGDNGSGSLSGIIAGIDWCTANADVIDVINLSLGGVGFSSSYELAFQRCTDAGVVVVVAAGNSARDIYGPDGVFRTSDDSVPAAYPSVATVSAMNDTDGLSGGLGASTGYGPDDTLASFSNYSRFVSNLNPVYSDGAAIDVAAPGVNILSTWLDGGYNTISGTSMAAPHYAGLVAFYIDANGRDVDSNGIVNGDDVRLIRQELIDLSAPQAEWGPSDTRDRDVNPEGLGSL